MGKEFLHNFKSEPADILFIDIEMPEMSGFELLAALEGDQRRPITVFVTGHAQYAIKAIKESVFDYLVKPVDYDELKATIHRIEQQFLTPAINEKIDLQAKLSQSEKNILKLIAVGMSSKEIAQHLSISPNTVNTHRNNILKKMDCRSVLEIISQLH